MDNTEKKLNVLFELEKYKEVLELGYETLYTSEVEKELLYQYIILSHMNLEEYQKALTMCDEALGEYPNIGTFFYLRSKTLYIISSYKKAFSDIQEALAIEPNEPRYLAHYAKLYLTQDNYIRAKETIEKALEIDSTQAEYHLTLAMVLYMLDGQKVAREILDDVLAKEPHNIEALTLKQKLFTSKLKEKKSLLQNLLFLDPFDKENQKEIKFIQHYYKFMLPLMSLVILLSYLLQAYRKEFAFLEPVVYGGFIVAGLLGSKDWRLNTPFIATIVSFDAYFNLGSRGIDFGEFFYIVFQAVLFQFVFMGAYTLFSLLKHKFETKLEQQQNSSKNPILFFLFIAPFESYEEVDTKAMRAYYTRIPALVLLSLVLMYIYNFYFQDFYFKIFLVVLFFITAILSVRNFLFALLYIFITVLLINKFACDGVVWCIVGALMLTSFFQAIYYLTRKKNG